MASGEQLKALLKSHADGDDDRFFSVAMQVAAHEARRGHRRLAEELRTLIDRAKSKPGAGAPVPIGRPRGELANLLGASYPSERLGQMVLGKELGDQIRRVMREQRHAGRIVERGLAPRRKLLLMGPPGTGKTLTASVLAGELGLPLLQVRLDGAVMLREDAYTVARPDEGAGGEKLGATAGRGPPLLHDDAVQHRSGLGRPTLDGYDQPVHYDTLNSTSP